MISRQQRAVFFHNNVAFHGLRHVRGRAVDGYFARHAHETYVLGLVVSGARRIVTRQGRRHIEAGEIFILNPGQSHSVETVDGQGHDYLAFSLCRSYLAEGMPPGVFPLFDQVSLMDCNLSARLLSLSDRCVKIPLPEEISYEIRRVVRHLLSSSTWRETVLPARPPVIQGVKDLIDENPGLKWSLKRLAHRAGLSPCHLQRTFSRCVGMSPLDYQTKKRVELAMYALVLGKSQVEAALEAGFFDQSHFSKSFKRLVGVSPGRWNSDLRGIQPPRTGFVLPDHGRLKTSMGLVTPFKR